MSLIGNLEVIFLVEKSPKTLKSYKIKILMKGSFGLVCNQRYPKKSLKRAGRVAE